jgi:hypothetical protein
MRCRGVALRNASARPRVARLPRLPLVSGALLVLACSANPSAPAAADDGACTAAPPCPNDPKPSSDQIDTCEKALASRCGPAYRAYLDCAAKNVTCDVSGHTDPASVDNACADVETAYAGCVAGPPDGG